MNHRIELLLLIFLFAACILPAQNPFIRQYTTADGLPFNYIQSVILDNNNFLWIGTSIGVARFDGSRFHYFHTRNGLSSNNVYHIQEDRLGRIWFFLTDGRLNFYFHDTLYNELELPSFDSLRSLGIFRKIFEDDNHTLFFYNNSFVEVFSFSPECNVKNHSLLEAFRKPQSDLPSILSQPIEDYFVDKTQNGRYRFWTQLGCIQLDNLTPEPKYIPNSLKLINVVRLGKNFFMQLSMRINKMAG